MRIVLEAFYDSTIILLSPRGLLDCHVLQEYDRAVLKALGQTEITGDIFFL